MLALLDAGVPISLLTRAGKLRGRLVPPEARNLPLRHAQYARAQDPAFCLEVSCAIVLGKLRNTRRLARRWARSTDVDADDTLALIDRAIERCPHTSTLSSLRGIEGTAAIAYFRILRKTLAEPLRFDKRSRRPPKDPANALLSLGYTLLTQNMMAACEVAGLDSYDGFYHADKYGRPALALDLIEPFRAVIVDSLVRRALNRRILKLNDFVFSRQGVFLNRRGLREFLRQYSQRINDQVYDQPSGQRLSYLQVFEAQARLMRQKIENKVDSYRPFAVK